ncbi:hypothetical protein PV768_19385 [Pseudarthrobacter sp. CC4]|uniref:hypothetical protein n=1 Tax=Pseudarthrobacter sp. CC4 TaxID=3029190 RepID=UPI003B8CD208
MALSQIASGDTGPERRRVEADFADKTSMIVEKLETLADRHPENIPALIDWLTSKYHELDDILAFVTPRHHVRWATARLFNKLDTGSAVEAIEAAGKAEEGLFLAANWIDAVSRESNFAQDTAKLFAPARTRFIQLVRETLDGYKTTNPLDIPNHIWALIWEWRSLEKEEAANWMNATVTDNGTVGDGRKVSHCDG